MPNLNGLKTKGAQPQQCLNEVDEESSLVINWHQNHGTEMAPCGDSKSGLRSAVETSFFGCEYYLAAV